VIRVAFYTPFGFHAPILGPVRDALKESAESLLSKNRRAIVAFDPHVLVMADGAHLEYFRLMLPGAFMVNVRHGMIGKGRLARLPKRASARRFDAVCVSDPLQVARFEREGARPDTFWLTGYPQLDPLFRRDPAPLLPLDATRPTVLYAPTWNLGLTSAGMIGDRLVELVRAQAPEGNILIKPHPVIGEWRPRWMERWARLARTHPGVHLVRDTHADIAPFLLASDVLISDASSVIFEFLVLDRPMILVTNPRHTADPAWAPDDIGWRWRDVGHEIHDVEEIPAAVALALRDPAARRERRHAYARILFERFADGQTCDRIAERVLEAGARVVRGEQPLAPRPPFASYLWHDLRTRLGQQMTIRRLVLDHFEGLRLCVRGWRRGASASRTHRERTE